MLLEIDHIRLSIGAHRILDDVSLTIDRGEIVGLIGPNGAGKTTTIAAALGLLPAEGGSIRLFGRPSAGDDPALRRSVGVMPEQNGFYDWMTAEDYLAFFAALHRRELDAAGAAERLAEVGLDPRPGQAIGTYSRGMRQRLALARALIGDPELLILDEPTNGLDPRGRREIHDLLSALSVTGVGVLLCTHLLDDVERLCARVGVIAGGRTVAEGAIGDLLHQTGGGERYRLRLADHRPREAPADCGARVAAWDGDRAILDVDAESAADAAWRRLMADGWPILEIRRESGSLEDLYLTLTGGSAR